jgi:hypothetical protein
MHCFDVMCSLTSADSLRFTEIKQNQKTTVDNKDKVVGSDIFSKIRKDIADAVSYSAAPNVGYRSLALAA